MLNVRFTSLSYMGLKNAFVTCVSTTIKNSQNNLLIGYAIINFDPLLLEIKADSNPDYRYNCYDTWVAGITE